MKNLRYSWLLIAALAACDSEETTGGDHTPADAGLFVAGVEVTAGLTLPAGQTTEVEVRFLDAHGDVIEGIEDHHFAALRFEPASLATTTYATGRHFVLMVTAQATAASGTVSVGYGHAEDADELEFGPIPVTVQ
jgi:hypothetical protein